MPVRDGPSCPGCGLANYEGMCPVCRGDEQATRDEGLPYPWPEDEAIPTSRTCTRCGGLTLTSADPLCSPCIAGVTEVPF